MADPGTKGMLMLLSLAAEEEAFLEYKKGAPLTPEDFITPHAFKGMTEPTRHFSAAGDDHAAIGTEKYLNLIAEKHVENRMKVSTTKHGISPVAGRYCEEIICLLPETELVPDKSVFYQTYEKSGMVDSVKLRLMGPETKPSQGSGSINPAIGKGPSLMKRLSWAPPGWNNFLNRVGRWRFLDRNRHNFPRKDGRINLMVELPRVLGGLQMSPYKWSHWDPGKSLSFCSDEHKAALQRVKERTGDFRDTIDILSRFAGDRYARGIPMSKVSLKVTKDKLPPFAKTSEEELREWLVDNGIVRDNAGYRHFQSAIQKQGYIQMDDLAQRLQRLEIQKELLRTVPNKGFESATWQQREEVLNSTLRADRLRQDLKLDYDEEGLVKWLKSYKNVDALTISLREKDEYVNSSEIIFETPSGGIMTLPELVEAQQLSMELPRLFTDVSCTTTLSSDTFAWTAHRH